MSMAASTSASDRVSEKRWLFSRSVTRSPSDRARKLATGIGEGRGNRSVIVSSSLSTLPEISRTVSDAIHSLRRLRLHRREGALPRVSSLTSGRGLGGPGRPFPQRYLDAAY